MSIATMAVYASRARGADDRPAGLNPNDDPVQSALGKVSAFVPAEAIGTYVALFGIFTPAAGRGRWALFLIAIAMALFCCWYLWWAKRRAETDPTKKLTRWQLVWMCVFAVVALTAWVGSIPDSPLLSLSWYSLKIGGGAVIILGIVLPKLGEVLGIAPK